MNAASALAIRTKISDRYEIREVLGTNGLSITYKAFDLFREKNCVLKELFPAVIVNRSFADKTGVELKRLSDEELFGQMTEHVIRQAKALIKLYPLDGIANVITCIEENGTVYVVSEYVEGVPLSEFLKHRKADRFELASILNFFSPMTESLKKLHENYVYHGKIRPDQILITPKNGVRLVGFGDPMEDVGKPPFLEQEMGVRNPRYSPVEQFMEEGKLGAYTDVYGLAATIYHCITRKEPIGFYDRIGQRDRMYTPVDLKVDISERQSEVVMKALAPHDFERYQTLDGWLADLIEDPNEIREVKPIVLYQPPFAFLEKLRFKRRVAAVLGVAALTVLIVFLRFVAGVVGNVNAVRFYQKFIREDLYGQCETLKWLGSRDRERFTNDYSRHASRDEMDPVYYDVRGKRMIDRETFMQRGKAFEILEIDYRENNLVFVIRYDREATTTYIIDLNNLGEAYQVTETVETFGVGSQVQNLSGGPDG
ncbi:MAG: protein kinase, partial [Lachnospiraceae bacterium]|nr:protein kinase [Lachnospiraceae bacterium]